MIASIHAVHPTQLAFRSTTCLPILLRIESRAHHSLRLHRAGRTPNPDIFCNSRIKFGMFHEKVGQHFAKAFLSSSGPFSSLPCHLSLHRLILPDAVLATWQPSVPTQYISSPPTLLTPAAAGWSLPQRYRWCRWCRQMVTGHYARSVVGPDGRHELRRSPDRVKDQTYFLSTLSQAQLAHSVFPVGDFEKKEVTLSFVDGSSGVLRLACQTP